MIKQFVTIIAVIAFSLTLISWGGTGHSKISNKSSLSFNSEMSEFNAWVTYLTDKASYADDRKSWDNEEGKKHYIDIDNYNDFKNTGKIEQNYVSAVYKYGLSFIYDNGTLPWATQVTFDSLKNCFIRHDWAKAKAFAADLGHYVADGHMPMHITDNFDGGNTGNNGIHSRYESTMINGYSSSIIYTGSSIAAITDVNQYIFNYIYYNNKYVDSVLIADNYAVTLAGGTRNNTTYSSSTYKQALWDKSKGFTVRLFKNASHALAELIYTAWVQAGKPSLATSDEQIINPQFTEVLEQNTPNPFNSYTTIRYNLTENSDVTIQIKDVIGNSVTTLIKGFKPAGNYTIDWTPKNLNEGIYFLVLDTKKLHQVKKMLLVR